MLELSSFILMKNVIGLNFTLLFSSLTLHAVNLSLWKKIVSPTLFKIITLSRPTTPIRFFLMGKSGCSTKGESWGVSLQAQKFDFSPSVEYCPTRKLSSPGSSLDYKTTYWRISDSFSTIFTKIFICRIHFQLHNHDLSEKTRWN